MDNLQLQCLKEIPLAQPVYVMKAHNGMMWCGDKNIRVIKIDVTPAFSVAQVFRVLNYVPLER